MMGQKIDIIEIPDIPGMPKTVVIPEYHFQELIIELREQRQALSKVVTAIEAAQEIIGPYDFENSNKVSLVMKLPSIIEAFKANKDKFTEVLNQEFYNKLKELTDEFSGN